MTQPTDTNKNRLAAALAGITGRQVAPRSDAAFDKEVDEELQREQFAKLWDQYSGYILAAMAAIVITVGVYKFVDWRKRVAAETAGTQYQLAIKDFLAGKAADGSQLLGKVAQSGGGFGTLARLRLAAADAGSGKLQDAVAKYDAIARERGIDPILAGFARLQTAMLSLDTASWDDMQARLGPLTDDASPWRYSARELLGMAALKAGKGDIGRQQFERLASDQNVPPGIAERARIVMGSIVATELAAKAAATAAPAVVAPTPPTGVVVPAPGATAPAAEAPKPAVPATAKK